MRRRGSFRSMADINITSLVDVTLTLLIIFMLTAPYIQGGVEVALQETRPQRRVERAVQTVHLPQCQWPQGAWLQSGASDADGRHTLQTILSTERRDTESLPDPTTTQADHQRGRPDC